MMLSIPNAAILAFLFLPVSVVDAGNLGPNYKTNKYSTHTNSTATTSNAHRPVHHDALLEGKDTAATTHGSAGRNNVVHSNNQLGKTMYESRIAGGTPSEKGEFPFFVSLGWCGASLIAPRVVLSAGTVLVTRLEFFILQHTAYQR
jgi:hypothetical protein